jgi:hypothetical protein
MCVTGCKDLGLADSSVSSEHRQCTDSMEHT